jgi:hypothetical protein
MDFNRMQQVLGRTNRLLSFDTAGTAEKTMRSKFFYCCVSILCCRNVFNESLPSNNKGDVCTNTQTASCSHKPTFMCSI